MDTTNRVLHKTSQVLDAADGRVKNNKRRVSRNKCCVIPVVCIDHGFIHKSNINSCIAAYCAVALYGAYAAPENWAI